jgi:hypothetical protein
LLSQLLIIILGTAAYKDLISILKHPQFCISDLPNNLSTVKKYRKNLPLMPILGTSVPISQKNTPFNSKSTKETYHFSILNHIERVLNNSFLRNHMYFGPGVETSNKKELWHGTLWQESPLFGTVTIRYNNGKSIIRACIFIAITCIIYFFIFKSRMKLETLSYINLIIYNIMEES